MDIKFKSPAYAFVLPDLRKYPADFRRFIERDIIEIATLRNLENSGFNFFHISTRIMKSQ